MMLKPLRAKAKQHQQIARPFSIPAPTKGWYVGENLASAPPKTAFYLQNVFPQLDYVRVRRGAQEWATGMTSAVVESLMVYSNAGVDAMFAGCGGRIYDVSNTGAVGSAKVSGLGNATFQYTQFTGLGGSYLVCVNGADGAQRFDGTNWNKTYSVTATTTSGNPTITSVSSVTGLIAGQAISGTGIPANTFIGTVGASTIGLVNASGSAVNATASNVGVAITVYQSPPITTTTGAIFSDVHTYKNRLYFVERNSLNLWYLDTYAIGGAATKFPMQGIFKDGGTIIAIDDWAVDSTSGIYSGFCVITSEGEVAMYDGLDPSSWGLKGVYRISRPLGARCKMKAGGDLLIGTEDGIVPMSKVETLDQVALQNVAVTLPIAPAWRQAVLDRAGQTGWQITPWSIESMGVVNLPKKDTGDRTQYVVNERTGAWSLYFGWDANCFAVFGNKLFYGASDGRVMQAEVGAADDGGNYTAIIFCSFDALNGAATRKDVRLIRAFTQANVSFSWSIAINVDFDTAIPNAPTVVLPSSSGAKWDVAVWDVDVWPATLTNSAVWQMVPAYGSLLAPVLQTRLSSASLTPDIRLTQIDLLYEEGNLIG